MKFTLFCLCAIAVTALAFAGVSGGHPYDLLTTGNPLWVVSWMAAAFALTAFAAGWITGDYSWIDRLWSTLPVVFAWIYAAQGAFGARSVILAGLITLWGARLTFNFARKGGYGKTEDYRWEYMRSVIPNPVLWQLFNLFFIALYQAAMFVLFTLPCWVVSQHQDRPLGILDAVAVLLFLGFLLIETIADQQQWNFQEKKRLGDSSDPDVKRGFLTRGLFRFSRHPNFFGEMGNWWAAWVFSVAATGVWFMGPGIIGAVMLTLLFQGSTWLTEKLSMKKYPTYAEYQKVTSRLIPWFSKGM